MDGESTCVAIHPNGAVLAVGGMVCLIEDVIYLIITL
jgi:hypothetical protein